MSNSSYCPSSFQKIFCCSSPSNENRATRNSMWENSTISRPVFDFVPDFLRSYCCVCWDYGNKKSIDTISLAVDRHDRLYEKLKNSENNNFSCEYLKKCSTAIASTPILHLNLNKPEHVNESPPKSFNESQQQQATTPSSAKSTTYSQKSTASARSDGSTELLQGRHSGSPEAPNIEIIEDIETAIVERESIKGKDESLQSIPDETILESTNKETSEAPLNRSASVNSLHSKTDSIKTQLEDTPPPLSRTQSIKSLIIEEIIEGSSGEGFADSFLVVEEILEEEQMSGTLMKEADNDSSSLKQANENYEKQDDIEDENDEASAKRASNPTSATSRPESRQRSPTIAELKIISRRNSMVKSMESLYDRRVSSTATTANSKQDSLDTSTETSSQSSVIQAVQSAVASTSSNKPQHTPLKQKAKTLCFLRNHRRISPVKQSIKMQQAELFPATLERFDKPREALLKTFDQLDSCNWEVVMQGLKSIVRLMRHHSDYLETQMHMVCIQLTRSVRNLRSQVARAACQAATEIFTLKSKALEQECDDLVCVLLHRTADTNRFLRADATRALESMSDNLMPPKILNIITTKGALHQNALVRTTAAKLLNRLVERLGYDKVFAMPRENRDKFFVTGANLLLEGSLETRSYAKSLFRMLSEHQNYNRLLLEVIPSRTYRNVEKTLKSIR